MCDFPADQHRCAMGGCHNGTYATFCGDHEREMTQWRIANGYVEQMRATLAESRRGEVEEDEQP